MRESQALDEQAYHFEIILNRNRPDLKLGRKLLKISGRSAQRREA